MDLFASVVPLASALFTWRACLDIALIGLGFFFLYHTLRASKTWKIFVGVLVSAGVFALARALDLKGLEWILSNLAGVAVLGLIVVFQPEVRKMLERAASLRRALPTRLAAGLAEVLADASFALAQQKRGALIVLPGLDPLRPWTSGGIELDAVPSTALLLSLFDPHSPGHDGAVLVERGRLAHFAVRLPLSTSGRLPEVLGTRHHAAQGLCEGADAFVIAVSEERGTVSAFKHGRMSAIESAPDLRARITAHWTEAGSPALPVEARRQSLRMLREAAVSVLGALLFWTTVVMGGGRLVQTGFTVPVVYTALPPNMALVGDKPSEIKIHVSGSSSDLDRIVPSQLPVTLDLSRIAPGRHRFPITDENLRLPRGVRLLSTDPRSVETVVTEMVERDVEVRPRLVGTLRRRLRLMATRVNPARLRVLAPASEPSRPLTTTPVDLGALTETATLIREIVAPPGIHPLSDAWPDVAVTLEVSARAPRRSTPTH